ncbi:hypothetical protein [Mycobacterium riyadhense]|uniref:hypothetical protein n=1 Tax=Mycobacterium riyadhense TaxID=486698 RepID=UPI001EFA0306|nr:hypothetical protein [Mycobacterium riyadhense]
MAPNNTRVNSIHPGFIRTHMTAKLPDDMLNSPFATKRTVGCVVVRTTPRQRQVVICDRCRVPHRRRLVADLSTMHTSLNYTEISCATVPSAPSALHLRRRADIAFASSAADIRNEQVHCYREVGDKVEQEIPNCGNCGPNRDKMQHCNSWLETGISGSA